MPRTASYLAKRSAKLPVEQFTILALIRLSDPIALTSVYPYLPSMIQSFPGVKLADVGFWAGTVGAVFSITQCITAIYWGRLSDRYGRKPILLLGQLSNMVTTLAWGFCTNLPTALFVRALAGAGNGNPGVIRTMVAELCPWKELQPRAFSLMPMMYNIGSIIGPMIGGSLANPLHRPLDDQTQGSFLWNFPYALPNLATLGFYTFGIVLCALFLNETLDADYRDYGIILGRQIKSQFVGLKNLVCRGSMYDPIPSSAPVSPAESIEDEEIGSSVWDEIPKSPKVIPPTWAEALSNQTLLLFACLVFLSVHNTAYDQQLAVFLHHARSGPEIVPDDLPFRFNKGFGMTSQNIGLLFTLDGFISMMIQIFLFPPVARRFGNHTVLKFGFALATIAYLVVPFTTLIEHNILRQILLVCTWICKTICATLAYPALTIMITNTADSIHVLGTINGMSTSAGALGRAIGPALIGYSFTWGVHHGYLLTPFWLCAFFSLASLVPLFWVEERDPSFSNCQSSSSSDDESEKDWAEKMPRLQLSLPATSKGAKRPKGTWGRPQLLPSNPEKEVSILNTERRTTSATPLLALESPESFAPEISYSDSSSKS